MDHCTAETPERRGTQIRQNRTGHDAEGPRQHTGYNGTNSSALGKAPNQTDTLRTRRSSAARVLRGVVARQWLRYPDDRAAGSAAPYQGRQRTAQQKPKRRMALGGKNRRLIFVATARNWLGPAREARILKTSRSWNR